jgi:hypothetical protein
MPLEVIGAGLGRTGTLSLKVALEQLGLGPCYHMTEVFAHPEHVPLWEAAGRGEPVVWGASPRDVGGATLALQCKAGVALRYKGCLSRGDRVALGPPASEQSTECVAALYLPGRCPSCGRDHVGPRASPVVR